jgi:hypothetical protein
MAWSAPFRVCHARLPCVTGLPRTAKVLWVRLVAPLAVYCGCPGPFQAGRLGGNGKPRLVPEMPHPGKHHRDVLLVGCGDHFVVAHAPPWLDNRACTRLRHDIDAVAKR